MGAAKQTTLDKTLTLYRQLPLGADSNVDNVRWQVDDDELALKVASSCLMKSSEAVSNCASHFWEKTAPVLR